MIFLFIIISLFNLLFVNNAQITSKCLADLASSNNCPAGWVSYEDNCYFIEKSVKMKQDDARKYCLNEGGKLVHFKDEKDFNFVSLKIQEVAINKSAQWFTAGQQILTSSVEYSWVGYSFEESKFSVKLMNLFIDKVPDINDLAKWNKKRTQISIGTDGSKWGFYIVDPAIEQFFVCEVSKGIVAKQLPRKRLADFNQVDALNIKRGPCITKQPKDQLYLPKVLSTDVVTFEVQFLGNPKPEVIWYFVLDAGKLKKLDPKSFTNGQVSQTDGILIISKPVNDDIFNSKIQAHITNEFGTVTSQIVQIIKGSLESYKSGDTMTHTKNINDAFTLDCKVPSHYPRESLQYTFQESRNINGKIKDTPIQPQLRNNLFLSQNLGMIGFSTVLKRDQAKYICMIQWKDLANPGSSFNSPGFVLNVNSNIQPEPNPSVDQRFPDIKPSKPKLGDKVVIECFGYGSTKIRQLTYIWTWNGKELSSRHVVTDLGRRITINDVQFEDQGVFACSIKDTNKVSPPKSTTLTINAVPTFINRPLNQYVDNGGNATFICGAIGIPDITLYWYRNSERLDTFLANPINKRDYGGRYNSTPQGSQVNSATLVIKNVKSIDNAMIGCQISNSYRTKSSYAELKTFAFKPNFKKFPITNIEAMQGQYVIIPCQPEGAPQPKIVWKFNDGVISTPPVKQDKVNGALTCDSDYCLLPNNNLNVSNVKAATKGSYTCQATNKYGKAESTGYLEVVDAVKKILEPIGRRIRVGTNVVLPCQASSSPSMDVDYDWYFENVRIRFDRLDRDARRYDASQFERPYNKYFGYMTISNIQFYDEGVYTCKITTPVTSTSYEAYYKVIGPPGECGGITIQKTNSSSFTVEWTDGTDRGQKITKFLIQKREYNTGNPTWYKMEEVMVNETDSTSNDVITRRKRNFSGLPASTNFQIRIIAFNSLGEGTPSPASQPFSTSAIPPTKIPQNVTGGGGKVFTLVVQWNKIDRIDENGPNFGFDVQYKQSKDDSWLPSIDNIVFRNISEMGVDKYRQATITLSDQKYYKLYQVRVRAKNSMGAGPWTKSHNIYSAPNMPQYSVKNVEVNSLNSTALQVFWKKPETKPEEGEIIGFHIIYWVRNNPCKDPQAYFDRLKSSQRLSLYRKTQYNGIIIGLEPDTYYCVGVQSINAAGDGPESSFFDQTTFKKAPQNWPTLVRLNSTGMPGTLRVRFNGVRVNPDEESVDGYKVRYWPTGAPVKTALDKDAAMKTETFVSGLRYDIRYNLRVFAYSRGGVGKLSNPMIQFTVVPKNKCVKDLVTEGVDVTFVFICGSCSKSISITLLIFSIIICLMKQLSNSI